MNARQIAVVACKALALYALLVVLDELPECWNFTSMRVANVSRSESIGIIALACVGPVLVLGVALFLWLKANWIAARMLAGLEDAPAENSPPMESGDLQTVVFAGIALFILAGCIAWLISTTILLPFRTGGMTTYTLLKYLTALIKMGLALGLLFGARPLARSVPRAVSWLRVAGRSPRTAEEDKS